MIRAVWVTCALAAGLRAAAVEADSSRGAQLFQTLSCVQCHSISGQGGTIGPDFGRRINRGFTPATLAATMWNHAPTMWAAMKQHDIRAADLDEQASRDLFAYFYSTHFFERPGDVGRGKNLFSSNRCGDCHGLKDAKIPEAKPVAQWRLDSPMSLASAMWNHASIMQEEAAARRISAKRVSVRRRSRYRGSWRELTSQDLDDMLVFLRSPRAMGNAAERLQITAGSSGQELFESKGCSECHLGRLALAPRLRNKTLIDIAVAMWNHEPRMAANPSQIDPEEMRELTSYLWAEQFFEDSGTAPGGEWVFTTKHCASCHNDRSSEAPKLTGAGRTYSGATMVSALWHHGPRMLDQMKNKGIAWPRFDGQDMANLIAYLNGKD